MQENLRRSGRVIKRPLKSDQIQDFAPPVHRTKAIQKPIIDPEDINQCARLMSKFINSTNRKFKKAKIEMKKIDDEPVPIKQFKVVQEPQESSSEYDLRKEQAKQRELKQKVILKLRETKSTIITSSKKQPKRRKRTKIDQAANAKDLDEPAINHNPQLAIFKRSSYHVAIAYHIYLQNKSSLHGEIKKQDLDPTILAMRLIQSRGAKMKENPT